MDREETMIKTLSELTKVVSTMLDTQGDMVNKISQMQKQLDTIEFNQTEGL